MSRIIKRLQFIMNIRKVLGDASIEELDILKKELHREYQRRNKKK